MKVKKRNILLSILLIISVGIYLINRLNSDYAFEEVNHLDSLLFDSKVEKVYFYSKSWGLAGNHSAILISNKKKETFNYDSLQDIRYINEARIFYEARHDTLLIYTTKTSIVPLGYSDKIVVKQIELNGEAFQKLNNNYKAMNISKFD